MIAPAVGADLIAVADVEAAIAEHGDRYLDRILTEAERAATGDRPLAIAEAFAAKEAALKALRPAAGAPIPWRDLELSADRRRVSLRRHAAELARARGVAAVAVSFSRVQGYAFAVAVTAASEGEDR